MRVVISALIVFNDSCRDERIASAVRESTVSAGAADSTGAWLVTTGTVTSALADAFRATLAGAVVGAVVGAVWVVGSVVFLDDFLSAGILFELTLVFEEAISNALVYL
jgi:hypothetical protein